MKKLDKMKMKEKLIFGYVLMAVLMILMAIIGIVGLFFLNGRLKQYINGPQAADTAVKMCRIEVNIAARNIREMALCGDKSQYDYYIDKVNTNIEELESNLNILEESGMLEPSLYEKYETALTEWIVIGNGIIDELNEGNKEKATEMILNECAPALQNAIDVAEEIDAVTDEEKQSAIAMSFQTVFFDTVVMAGLLILAIVMALIVGSKIIRSITRPLEAIEKVAQDLSEGNLHSQLEYHSEDELGMLAHSLRKSIRTLGEYVDDIGIAMKEFSAGNFDVKPQVEWKGDFINIKDSFMSFERTMADTVKGIQRVADQVTSGAQQVSASSMELAQGATDQAGITEELSATIENVSAHVRQNAEDARAISGDVQAVGVEIVNSNEKMQEMVESMREIDESSKQISKIIATINEIAAQTNLLSLNASIEAARAGEAGRGFAVVADQVSVLASQSAEAAKESTALIESSVRAVEKGMVIADETAVQLKNVVAGSEEITEKVDRIAEASEEQAMSIAQINKGVEHINEVVQTNSATSQECAAASQEMTGQAETLDQLIRHFKVGKFH